jgi:NAD-dependent deacetylase
MIDFSVNTHERIRYAADILNASRNTVVLTGAGISTPSGIPDFRSNEGGLWERYDPFEVASLSAFRYRPQRFYEWLRPLAHTMHNAQPNPAHFALARLENGGKIQTIITQNIDRLHQRAGAKNVLEVHGSLETMTCAACFHQEQAEPYVQAFVQYGTIPACPRCQSVLKPDVVLFGEQLPYRPWLKAVEASRGCDLMIVAGSSLEVLPVASLPMRSVENGAHLIIINRMATYLDVRADVVFDEDVAQIIPAIVKEVMGD